MSPCQHCVLYRTEHIICGTKYIHHFTTKRKLTTLLKQPTELDSHHLSQLWRKMTLQHHFLKNWLHFKDQNQFQSQPEKNHRIVSRQSNLFFKRDNLKSKIEIARCLRFPLFSFRGQFFKTLRIHHYGQSLNASSHGDH